MDDELISEARKIAIDFNGVEQKLKPVHLQHRMRIGINRATKLYEQLKNEGLIQQSPREAVLFCAQKKKTTVSAVLLLCNKQEKYSILCHTFQHKNRPLSGNSGQELNEKDVRVVS